MYIRGFNLIFCKQETAAESSSPSSFAVALAPVPTLVPAQLVAPPERKPKPVPLAARTDAPAPAPVPPGLLKKGAYNQPSIPVR